MSSAFWVFVWLQAVLNFVFAWAIIGLRRSGGRP